MNTQYTQIPTTVTTRFAPSPSGNLHVGGARTALLCWAYAKGQNGKFILRIEDTDQQRSSDSASAGFLQNLDWLGIQWDEGPIHENPDTGKIIGGGNNGPYYQSQRLEIYNKYFQQLINENKAYYAFETSEELKAKRDAARANKITYKYDRAALNLTPQQIDQYLKEGRHAVIRLKTPDDDQPVIIHDEVLGSTTIPPDEISDFIIRKADGYPTYHFAVVIDDALMGVTHVLRAQEHYKNTAKHMLLQDALNFYRPTYAHLSVIVNPDNSKMSKRDKDKFLRHTIKETSLIDSQIQAINHLLTPDLYNNWLKNPDIQLDLDQTTKLAQILNTTLPEINVEDFRRSGYLPSVVCNFLALNGWSPGSDLEKFDNDFLTQNFNFDRVIKAPAKFDRAKLLAFNHDAIQVLTPQDFTQAVLTHAQRYNPDFVNKFTPEQFQLITTCNQTRSKTLEDPITSSLFLVTPDNEISYEDTKAIRKAMRRGKDHLIQIKTLLANISPENFTAPNLENTIKTYTESNAEGKLGDVAQPIRIAVTGSTISPPIFDTLTLLGKNSVINRINRCLELNIGCVD